MKLRLLTVLAILLASPAIADTPENVTLQLRFDAGQAYADGEEITVSPDTINDFSYPYLVSNQPTGIVSYSEALEIRYEEISDSEDMFEITQSGGTFLLPHTTGGYQTVEDKEDEISNRDMLSNINPSFNFPAPTTERVKVSYRFPYKISSFEGPKQDIDQLTVRNKLNGKSNIELDLRGS